jgi:glutamate/aspartate transport system permease protein
MDSGFDFDVIQRSWVYLFREGMTFTLTLTALAMVGGIFFGTLLAMMRLANNRIASALAGGYVDLMRSIPLVLVIFWFFFLVPYIGAWIIGASRPIAVGAFWSAAITFTMFEAAYYSEIMRAGIQSIPLIGDFIPKTDSMSISRIIGTDSRNTARPRLPSV